MDYVPDSAVCNEAVKLAEKRKFHSLKGFVNGVLRSIARSREALLLPDPEKDKNISWKEALSIKASMPMLIIDLWEADYGKEKTIEMTNHLLDIKAVTIRMEETLEDTKRGELEEAWKKQGVQVNRHPLIPYAYLCTGLESVTELPGFEEGLITVQDASSMLVTECANIQKNDFDLDLFPHPEIDSRYSIHISMQKQFFMSINFTPLMCMCVTNFIYIFIINQSGQQCCTCKYWFNNLVQTYDTCPVSFYGTFGLSAS